jgi:predicted RNA-binding Zn-ribbon protein involved in translation (DUF1610 family)
MSTETVLSCDNCGFEAPVGSDEWERVALSSSRTVTKCPDCGSTNVHNRG